MKHTPGPASQPVNYGSGYEIQAGGKSLCIVGGIAIKHRATLEKNLRRLESKGESTDLIVRDIARLDETDHLANARHLSECWNACEGINPETVPKLLAIAKEVVLFAPEYAGNDDLNAALSDLEAIIGLAEPEGD